MMYRSYLLGKYLRKFSRCYWSPTTQTNCIVCQYRVVMASADRKMAHQVSEAEDANSFLTMSDKIK